MDNHLKIDATNAPILKYIEESLMVEDNLKEWQIKYFTQDENIMLSKQNPPYLQSRCPNCGHLSINNVANKILLEETEEALTNCQESAFCHVCEQYYDPYNSIMHELLTYLGEFLECPESKSRLAVLRNCYNFHKGIKE